MGNKYVVGYNPFRDFLLQSVMYDVNVTNNSIKNDIREVFVILLERILDNEKDVLYLDFDIIDNNGHIKLIGKNAISALWLSGIFPRNIKEIICSNVFRIDNRQYRYNKKIKVLTYKIIE